MYEKYSALYWGKLDHTLQNKEHEQTVEGTEDKNDGYTQDLLLLVTNIVPVAPLQVGALASKTT